MPEKKKDCFVVGPIGPADSDKRIHTEWVRDAVIKPVLEPAGFTVHHPLEMAQPGLIDTQVISYLLNAELVIADLTTQNANAFYEIGIRHMAQKPIIHMHKVGEAIPFDLSLYRSIEFSLARPRDVDQAKSDLKKAVEAAMAPDYTVDNPVTHARGVVKLQEGASDPQRVLLDELEGIKERLLKIEVDRHSEKQFALAKRALVRSGNALGPLTTKPAPNYNTPIQKLLFDNGGAYDSILGKLLELQDEDEAQQENLLRKFQEKQDKEKDT